MMSRLPEDERPTGVLQQAHAIWSRRRWLIVVVFLFPVAALGTVLAVVPSLYQATATVLVERRTPETLVKPTVPGDLDVRLQVLMRDVLTPARLAPLVEQFGLYPELRERMSATEVGDHMRRAISIETQAVERKGRGDFGTISFTVSFRYLDPAVASDVTNAVAVLFVDENLLARTAGATTTAAFLRSQLDETKRRLEEHERAVGAFKQQHAGSLPEELNVNLMAVERLGSDLRANASEQRRIIERRDAVLEQLGDPSRSSRSGSPESSRTRLARLKEELGELRTRFTERYPDVVRLKQEIAELEAGLAREPRVAEPAALTAQQQRRLAPLDSELKQLKDEERRIKDAIATAQRRIDQAPRRQQEYQRLARDWEATRELYRTLLVRHDEAQMGEDAEQGQKAERFRVVEPAKPSSTPVAPNRLKLLLSGAALALGAAVAAAVVAEQVDTSFHSVDGVRAVTRVPVVAVVPRIVREPDVRRRRRRAWLGAVAVAAALLAVVALGYVIAHDNRELLGLLTRGRV